MVLKLWFLVCATQLVIIKGTSDPAYAGIKTRSYHRVNPQPYDAGPGSSYDNSNYDANSQRLSAINTHYQYNEESGKQNQPTYHQQQHHTNPQQQQQQQPIYNRNAHVRHSTSTSERTENVPSSDVQPPFADYQAGCPPQHTGPLPYAYDCRRFVNCWHGRSEIQSCGPGTLFNPDTLVCDYPNKVVCRTPNANVVDGVDPNKYRAGRLLDASTDSVDSVCPVGKSDFVPHPTDCTKFVNCDNGIAHVQSCPPGTAFNTFIMRCDFKNKVDCSDRASSGYGPSNSRDGRKYANNNLKETPINEELPNKEVEGDIFCLSLITGNFAYPFDKTKFLKCALGKTAIQNCAPGRVFSISKNYCVPNENIDAIDHVDYVLSETQEMSSTIVSCPPSTAGIHLYPYNCRKYIHCLNGIILIGTCHGNKVFDIAAKTCRPESEVRISDRVPSKYIVADTLNSRNSVECRKDQSGLYPYPFDCRKYLRCQNGSLNIESCRSNYVFSLAAKTCNPRDLVRVNEYVQCSFNVEQDKVSKTDYDYSNYNQETGQLTCPSNGDGVFLHPFDCTKYLNCFNGKIQVENCPTSNVYSISRHRCVNPTQVDAYDRVDYVSEVQHEFSKESQQTDSQSLETMCASRADGIYPYAADKTKYINCFSGRAKIEDCVKGMVFSTARRHCDYESKVYADDRNDYDIVNANGGWQSSTLPKSSTEVQCPPAAQGFYPHPYDCNKFLSCKNGVTQIKACGQGTAWNAKMEVCDFENNVNCAQRTKGRSKLTNTITADQVTCPQNVNGRFLHPFDAKKYIVCQNGETSVQTCPMHSIFSISRKICFAEVEVNTVDRVQCPQDFAAGPSPWYNNDNVVCPPHALGYFAYPFDSIQFINCQSGHTMLLQQCAPNMIFSTTNLVCVPADEAGGSAYSSYDHTHEGSSAPRTTSNVVHTVTSSGHTVQSKACATSESGHYPHPTDCTKYLRCANGISYVMDCGPGTAFNAALEVCDFKDNVDCSRSVDNDKLATTVTDEDNRDARYNTNPNLQPLPPQPNYRGSTYNDQHHRPHHHEHNGHLPQRTEYGNPSYGSGLATSSSRTGTYNDRWSDMDRQRPLPSDTAYEPENNNNPDKDRQQRQFIPVQAVNPNFSFAAGWTATGAVDRQTPISSVTYEEGSLQPNRNYNTVHTYKTPLASFNTDTLTAANETQTLYYAQPVGSEEKSEEVFNHKSDFPTTTLLPFDQTENNKWISIPNQMLLPPKRTTAQQSDRIGSAPKNVYAPESYNTPPSRQQLHSQLGEPSTILQNSFDSSNLYGGLQPPPPPTTPQTLLSNADTFVAYPPSSRSDGRSVETIEHIRGFSTNMNEQPYYPIPHSNTNGDETPILNTTPAIYLQPPALPTPATKSYSPSTTLLRKVHPLLEHTTVAMFSKDPHYSNAYSNVAHASPVKSVNFPDTQNSENLPMTDALKLLLRPYFNRSGTILDYSGEKAESHIMQLAAKQPSIPNTIVPLHNKIAKDGAENEQEVELIFAGEQHSLTTIPSQNGTHELRAELYTKNTKQESKNNPNWHNRGHSREFHRNHPNLLNPLVEDEYPSPHSHHRHHHNRAFHQSHPDMPNPFVAPEAARTLPSTTPNIDLINTNLQNPNAESTTPLNIRPQLDLRGAFNDDDCQFDCGNGRCVASFEVCNGINNCGNRKDEEDCKHLGYEVRLTDGESANRGNIQVKILGKWGYICHNKFGLNEAAVACRELGFQLGAREVFANSHYYPTELQVSFAMDEVNCRGNETSLKECNFKGWGVSSCGIRDIAGVDCKVQKLKCPNNYWLCSTSQECIPPEFVCDHTPDCADKSDESDYVCNSPVKYRLAGGRSPNEGRLEVQYHGEWGTVCDDDFGLKEAQVICNSMGLYGLPTIVKHTYGPGAGPIWLDQVSCFGNETLLDQCSHWTWGEHNCNHTEDVGLKCTVGASPQKINILPIETNDESIQKELDEPQKELEDIDPAQWERKSKALGAQRRCGHFKDNIIDEYAHPEERVVNGSLAKRGNHPWQATIRTRGRGGISSHWCGAVLISTRHLLTAAHCLAGYPKGAYLVRMGDHYANIAESSEVDSFIENWFVHEKFRDATHMNNDIALIVLKTPVKFNDYIQPVCLPSKGASLMEHRQCKISGWGSIKSGVSTPSNILRAAELPILSDEVCKQPHVYGASLTEGMFCAGYMNESADACDGDSGGPLICHDEDGETLYGIISWGQHCGYANKPGVYVRVEKYVDWILEKISFSMQNAS